MILKLGLTGSIGMGKSTTAAMFRNAGIPVYDADTAVHQLYAGEAATLIEAAFPGVVINGMVDRGLLSPQVIGKPEAMKKLEAIVHPLVRVKEKAFIQAAQQNRASLVVLDIPLLFETGGDERVDVIAVVSASPAVQRKRVLARPGMTVERFEAILVKQLPDADKRRKAHFVIDTGHGLEQTDQQVRDIIRALAGVTVPNRSEV